MEAHPQHLPAPPPSRLAGFMTLDDWLDGGHAGPFFASRGSVRWFIHRHRIELIECGALLPREGRNASLVQAEAFPAAVVEILRRKALERSHNTEPAK